MKTGIPYTNENVGDLFLSPYASYIMEDNSVIFSSSLFGTRKKYVIQHDSCIELTKFLEQGISYEKSVKEFSEELIADMYINGFIE